MNRHAEALLLLCSCACSFWRVAANHPAASIHLLLMAACITPLAVPCWGSSGSGCWTSAAAEGQVSTVIDIDHIRMGCFLLGVLQQLQPGTASTKVCIACCLSG
jgi:hypothetical protein